MGILFNPSNAGCGTSWLFKLNNSGGRINGNLGIINHPPIIFLKDCHILAPGYVFLLDRVFENIIFVIGFVIKINRFKEVII